MELPKSSPRRNCYRCLLLITMVMTGTILLGCHLQGTKIDREHLHVYEPSALVESDQNLTSETNQTIRHGQDTTEHNVTEIVSIFGGYCMHFSLHWFQRLLYSQTLRSTSIPRFVFVFVHTMNGTNCTGYNSNRAVYQFIAHYIEIYFKHDIRIFLYFDEQQHSAAYTRNFLIDRVNEFINAPQQRQSLQRMLHKYHHHVVISSTDMDDVSFPQKMQVMDWMYSQRDINGTVLHSFKHNNCKRIAVDIVDAANQHFARLMTEFARYTAAVDTDRVDHVTTFVEKPAIYALMNEFHEAHSRRVLDGLFGHNHTVDMEKLSFEQVVNTSLTWEHVKHATFWILWKLERNFADDMPIANGWPTSTLHTYLRNRFDSGKPMAEDSVFNYETLRSNISVYLLKQELGVYCRGNVGVKYKHKDDRRRV